MADFQEMMAIIFIFISLQLRILYIGFFIIIILLPWMVIDFRLNIIQKIFEFYYDMILKNNENGETNKRFGLFY